MTRLGALIIALGAAIGLVVSIYNYFISPGLFAPFSDVAGTIGGLLVIGSTALMLLAGLILAGLPRSRILTWIAIIGCLLDIVGTGFAALLLDSTPLLIAMAICAVGWVLWIFAGRRAHAHATA